MFLDISQELKDLKRSSLHHYFHGFVIIALHLDVGDPAVSLGRSDGTVTQQILDRLQIGIGI